MQDPNEDTEWNDILRKKGIIPQKEPTEAEISEDTIVQLMEDAIRAKSGVKDLEDMTLDELNENEDDVDEEEERIFQAYRQQRLAEMKAANQKACYGSVLEISKADYVREVNQAGEGVWVVLHVYKNSTPLCKLLNEHMTQLSQKFPDVKFIRSESSVCIPNYPDKNLPTIFVYHEGDMKKQWIGTLSFGGMGFTRDDFEWMLSQASVLKTTLEENPRKQVQDVMTSAIRGARVDADSGDEDDW